MSSTNIHPVPTQKNDRRPSVAARQYPKVYALNFWPGFSFESGLFPHLFGMALGPFETVATEDEADIVLVSLFPRFTRVKGLLPSLVRETPKRPERSIAVLWENVRPDYTKYAYSISSDFDHYDGRNVRVPFWYTQIHWPGMKNAVPPKDKKVWSGFEPLIPLHALTRPRVPAAPGERDRFCCFVAGNREPHRLLAVEALSRIRPVDLYGPISGKVFRGPKYELLSKYRFNLCFENSAFPGYYTEKILQAWYGGCIPLYYSDPWYGIDFNRNAAINRIDYPTLERFVDRVEEVERSRDAFDEIFAEPLLIEEPQIDDAVEFLRQACSAILDKRV